MPPSPARCREAFAAKLEQAGVDVELLLLETGHAFLLKPMSSPENEASHEAIEAFLAGLSGG